MRTGIVRRMCSVQFYVKSSALSRSADLAISPHLATETDIDRFVDDAIASLQAIRVDAKRALTMAQHGLTRLGSRLESQPQMPSFFFRMSLTAAGLALPPVPFIT